MRSKRRRIRSLPAGRRHAAAGTAEPTSGSRNPQLPEINGGVAGLPTAQETLDRRMQDDVVEITDLEEPVPAHGCIPRGDRFERSPAEIAREDDVHDMLRREAVPRGDRVDECDGSFHRELIVDADLLGELAVQRVDETLAAVDAAAGQKPVLLARLLVAAEEHAPLPAQDRRDTDARLGLHHVAEDPNPRTPRSLAGSSSTSTSSSSGIGRTTSCAIRIPRSTTNGSVASVFSSTTRSSPRYPESTRPGEFTTVRPWRAASPERGCTKPA